MKSATNSKGVRWQASLTLALILQGSLATVAWHQLKIHPWFAWLGASSVITFLYYGMDKWSAGRGWRRTPEVAIWMLILIGGVAGGWLGQIVFRHKTRKGSFWLVLVLAAFIHGTLLWVFRDQLDWRRG